MKKIIQNLLVFIVCVLPLVKGECQHDSDEEIKRFQEEFSQQYFNSILPNHESQNSLRKLQNSQEIQNIRVTLDFSYLDTLQLGITDKQKAYIQKISKIAAQFVTKLIKVKPLMGNNIYGSSLRCIDIAVPSNDQKTGVENSDLNLYIIYFNSGSSALANAASCFINPAYQRPTFGRVSFNIGYLTNTNPNSFKFQLDLQVLLHEIIHVLGFSSDSMQYWIDPDTQKPYKLSGISKINTYQTVRGFKTLILTSKNVTDIARKHYNCSQLIGMQIENQGGSGSAGSHWERTVIMNEIMTAQQVSIGATLSQFTIALLKDTGFWADVNVNIAGQILWGKNQGCDFYNQACQSSNKANYLEFVSSSQVEGCSLTNDGYGIGINDGFSDNCYYIQPYSNMLCTDLSNQNNSQTDLKLESYSTNSRCFMSTLTKPGMLGSFSSKSRCHESQCSSDFSTITISIRQLNITIECNQPGQSKAINYNNKKIGDLECPKNFNYFCSNNQQCINNCSSNGLCINKVCHCAEGFTGADCSISCLSFYENGNCVNNCSSGNYANPDKTCRSTCPDGYFGDTKTNLCQQCDFSCKQCNSSPSQSQSLQKNCTKCSLYKYLYQGNCLDSCPAGYYGDDLSQECKKCSQGCLSCENSEKCIQCDSNAGVILNQGICGSLNCDQFSNCNQCSSKTCLDCKSGFYLLNLNCVTPEQCGDGYYANKNTKLCEKCGDGCAKCSSKDLCNECAVGYRLSGGICTNCTYPCQKCDLINKSACQTCESGYFLYQNSTCVDKCPKNTYLDSVSQICYACQKGCVDCQNQLKCNQCEEISGYYLFDNQQCVLKGDCFSPCLVCQDPKNPKLCSKCQDGYALQDNLCVQQCKQGYYSQSVNGINTCLKCSDTCLQCSLQAEKCLSCSNEKVLYNDKCLTQCPKDYIKTNNNICKKAYDDTVINSSKNLSFYGIETAFIFGFLIIIIAFV
ncbi:hypothetical protein ABPG74_012135 [Tetrahymena malaccensis]